MVSMDKVKRGVARYVDDEFINKMSGWQKWVVGAGVAMFIENLASNVQAWKNNPVIKSLGLIDDANGIAVEQVHQQLKVQAQKGPVTFEIPMLGTITLHESDVDKLYRFIMEG